MDDKTKKEMTQEVFDKLKKAGTNINYTTPKAGQQMYGGVTPKGKKRWKVLKEQVRENSEKNVESIKMVEDKVLVMVRKVHNRDVMDAKKKGKGKKKKTPVVEEESEVNSNDDNL